MKRFSIAFIVILVLGVPLILSMIFSKLKLIEIFLIFFITFVINILAFIIKQKLDNSIQLKPNFNEKYYREIPNIKPALLWYYISKDFYKDKFDFYATILDLINRNVLILETTKNNYSLKKNHTLSKYSLNKYESHLIDLLFKDNDEIDFSTIKSNVDLDTLFQGRIDAWKMFVQLDAQQNEYLLENKKIKILKKSSSIICTLLCASFYLLLLISSEYNISAYIFLLILCMTSFSWHFSTVNDLIYKQEIIDEIEKSKALKRYFEDYSLIESKSISDIVLWERYLVYATILDTPQEIKKYFDNIFKKNK